MLSSLQPLASGVNKLPNSLTSEFALTGLALEFSITADKPFMTYATRYYKHANEQLEALHPAQQQISELAAERDALRYALTQSLYDNLQYVADMCDISVPLVTNKRDNGYLGTYVNNVYKYADEQPNAIQAYLQPFPQAYQALVPCLLPFPQVVSAARVSTKRNSWTVECDCWKCSAAASSEDTGPHSSFLRMSSLSFPSRCSPSSLVEDTARQVFVSMLLPKSFIPAIRVLCLKHLAGDLQGAF